MQRVVTTPTLRPTVLRHHLVLNQMLSEAHHVTTQTKRPVTDRRRYTPTILASAKTLAGQPARFNRHRLSGVYASPWQYLRPKSIDICIRRKERREVLHALRRTGKGARAQRKYTAHTYVKC